MSATIGELDLDEAAEKAAGNWQEFDSFTWHRATDLDDPEAWTIIYTHHRDSKLLEQSNAAVIARSLESFAEGDDPDVIAERHRHFAVGWIDGFSIRVFRDGEITEAFQTYHELAQRRAEYEVLDEGDFSNREYEATLLNIGLAAWRLRKEFKLPDGWEAEVLSWLWDHNPGAIENTDDDGGWPETPDLTAAFVALGYKRAN